MSANTSVPVDVAKAKADALAAEILANQPDLTIIYIIHQRGQLQSALHMAEDIFLSHPAGQIAVTISGRLFPPNEPSAFHGLSAKQASGLLGLSATTAYLAVISMNIDQYESVMAFNFDLYRHTWHALEHAYLMRSNPPERPPGRPITIKRGTIEETRSFLRADLFALFFMIGDGHEKALKYLSKQRAGEVLNRRPGHSPQRYIFPMIAQAARFAITDIMPHLSKNKPRLQRFMAVALELADSVSDEQIKLWHRLCDLSQDMAWSGASAGAIIGAAVHTSDDAYLRSVMHTISELANIDPLEPDSIRAMFNPHIGVDGNQAAHDSLIDLAFEDTLVQAQILGTPKPLFERAEAQNLDLLHGRFMGWCAIALQSAGQVLARPESQNITQAQAARIEFEGQSHLPGLAALYRFAREVQTQRHNGQTMTLERLIEIAHEFNDLELLVRSLEYTVAHRFHDTLSVAPDDSQEELAPEVSEALSERISNEDPKQRLRTHPSNVQSTPSEFALEDEK